MLPSSRPLFFNDTNDYVRPSCALAKSQPPSLSPFPLGPNRTADFQTREVQSKKVAVSTGLSLDWAAGSSQFGIVPHLPGRQKMSNGRKSPLLLSGVFEERPIDQSADVKKSPSALYNK
jgi:hypothetical protein